MPLKGAARSNEAEALVSTVMEAIIMPFRAAQKQLRPSMIPKYRKALSAFLADLLAAASAGKWGRCGTSNAALSGCPGSRQAFLDVRTALVSSGSVEEIGGFVAKVSATDGTPLENIYERTVFRPTTKLLALAEEEGVLLTDFRQHFFPSGAKPWVPGAYVEARATKPGNKKAPGRCLEIDTNDPVALSILERMERLNAFLLEEGRVTGILFGGLRRVFHDADQPGFKWQTGGRFYSMQNWDAYEQLKGGKASRSREIRIDGEAVDEVDISAAHLTLLYGLLGVHFDGTQDPYAVPGFGRKAVKDWIKVALGASDETIGGPKCSKVRKACVKRHPILAGLYGHGVGTLDLQYHESEIILAAVEDLRDLYGVGCLPIHDGLIIPQSQRDLAHAVLVEAFQRYFRDTPNKEVIPVPRVA
jgi:hypothetical protein